MAGMSKEERERMMKDCMRQQQEKDSSMSADQMRKTCAEHMKMRSSEKEMRSGEKKQR